MGTRAAFWIGDPRDVQGREWLGCIACDGFPNERDISAARRATTERQFRGAMNQIARRSDFTFPLRHGWPFPWDNDIFLTDYTYAFFDGQVWLSCFHAGLVPARDLRKLRRYFSRDDAPDDPTLNKVPAPSKYDRTAPDSIFVIAGRT
jgi:hypothetical protein